MADYLVQQRVAEVVCLMMPPPPARKQADVQRSFAEAVAAEGQCWVSVLFAELQDSVPQGWAAWPGIQLWKLATFRA